MEYYKRKKYVAFIGLLESSQHYAHLEYKNSNKDQMRALDLLAAYYMQMAVRENNKDIRCKLFSRASQFYSTADNIIMYDTVSILLFNVFFLNSSEYFIYFAESSTGSSLLALIRRR